MKLLKNEVRLLAERKIYLLEKSHKSEHRFKYRLYYGTGDGTCMVRYDNEQGKGDHRHIGGKEELYRFRDVDTLVRDFMQDIDSVRGGRHGKED
jgi:hypothetical protein